MKKIFTLFASSLFAVSVFAAAKPKSTLMVQSLGMDNLSVEIDGRRFEPDHNSVRITGLDAGQHQVRIYREKSTGLFNLFGKKYETIYNNSIRLRARTDMIISIDRSGRATITENRRNGNAKPVDRDFDGRDWNSGNDFEFDRGGNYGVYDDPYGYETGMNDREFSQVLNAIGKEWLESNKLKSATQIVTSNRLTTAQVKRMMLLFSLENNKLELAKSAYANTVDKRNYGMINDAFAFSNSKEEMARFIRNFH